VTFEERATAVEPFGFTPRQARFLVTVMLHAGVCVQRQYAQFAGIANGQITRDFFGRLVRERIATAYPCWRGVARVYHIHHKALYCAIGEPNNRHRRRLVVGRATDRLMVLDAVLNTPQTAWLGSEHEKVVHCVHGLGVDEADLPQLAFETAGLQTVRYFPDKLPIAINGPELALLFVVKDTNAGPFRQFLNSHRRLMERVNRGRVVLAIPRSLPTAQGNHTAVADSVFGAPLRPAVLEEFQWFCRTRRTKEQRSALILAADRARYAAAKRAFGSRRFFEVYRDWLKRGDVVFASLRSPRLYESWRRGDWRLEILVLPHDYEHLSPSLVIAVKGVNGGVNASGER
jgi:hypothetical protein